MKLLYSMVQQDAEGLATILLEWAGRKGEKPGELLEQVDEFLDKYKVTGTDMKKMDMAVMVNDLLGLVRNNKLSMPPDQAMLLKVFVSLEGAFRKLDPEFDMITTIQPILTQTVMEQFSPQNLAKRGFKVLAEAAEFLGELPKELHRLITQAQDGKLRVQVEIHQLDDFTKRISRLGNRLAMAAITSALILGTSIVMSLATGPTVYGINIYEGFAVGALVGGIWVLYSIWREKT
jgi:ubiquinone biosynthesis protein